MASRRFAVAGQILQDVQKVQRIQIIWIAAEDGLIAGMYVLKTAGLGVAPKPLEEPRLGP